MYASYLDIGRRHLFSITAIRIFTLLKSIPTAVRLGNPKAVSLTSACSSRSIGLVPSIEQATTAPLAPIGLPESIYSEGLGTSFSPSPAISKTPISLVEPNLFLTALSIL